MIRAVEIFACLFPALLRQATNSPLFESMATMAIVEHATIQPLDNLMRPLLALEVAHDQHIGVHESPNTVLHAGVFTAVELAARNTTGDALAEADVGEMVNGWRN
jgi:hypothetical protein